MLFKHTNKKLKKGYHWQIKFTITQNNREFLENIKKELGYGSISIMNKKANPIKNIKASICYYLTLSSDHLREFLPLIIPHLRIKKEQAVLLLEALTLISNNYIKGKKSSLDYTNKMESIASEIKKLKKM